VSELIRPGDINGRYVLPSFTERTSYGVREMNPYAKLFEDRIIFLGVQVDDASANDVMAQLLTLESLDPDRDRGFSAEEAKAYGFDDHVFSSAAQTGKSSGGDDNPVTGDK
jgi:ATP-dependent protease ClpP protease subunit